MMASDLIENLAPAIFKCSSLEDLWGPSQAWTDLTLHFNGHFPGEPGVY